MDDNRTVIKKYENRRLYDTARSRYVNLDEVAALIRDGVDVQVLDARTGEDITRLILTQIIVEEAKEREFTLPLDVLRQIVAASGRASQEGVANYWRTVSSMYQNAYRAFAAPVSPVDLLRTMFNPGSATGTASPQSPSTAAQPERESEPDISELRRRIEELERLLAAKAPRSAKTKPRPKRS